MMNSAATDAPDDWSARDISRTGQCLRYQATFRSEWLAGGFVLTAKVPPRGGMVRRIGPILPPTDVNRGARGHIRTWAKHLCPECASKYYDLNRKVVTCPQCGAKPPVATLLKSVRPVRKTSRTAFRR